MQHDRAAMQKTLVPTWTPPPQPSPASGGGSRPSSPLALIPLHANMLYLQLNQRDGPRSSLLVATRARDLLLQHVPDVELEPAELRRCRQRHEVARARERHVDDPLDAAGLRGHDHGAVAEQQRLLDRMGDVDHGLAGLLPNSEKLGLQDDAILRIERGE